MKTKFEEKIENDVKIEVQLALDDDSIDMAKVDDDEFEEHMIEALHVKQKSKIKDIARGLVKKTIPGLVLSTAISALCGVLICRMGHPDFIPFAAIPFFASLLFSKDKLKYARKLGKLSRASQEKQAALAEKYASKINHPAFETSKKIIDTSKGLNAARMYKQFAKLPSQSLSEPDVETDEERLHKEIINEYRCSSMECDELYDEYLEKC